MNLKLKPKKQAITISFSIPEDDAKKLDKYVVTKKTTRSSVLQAIVKEFLERVK